MIAEAAASATLKTITKKRGRSRKVNGRRPPILPTAIYSRSDAAYVLDCSEITLLRAYGAGHLSGYKQGRYVKHSGQHLMDWLEAGGKTGWSKQPKEDASA
jgi:hypothetical protein